MRLTNIFKKITRTAVVAIALPAMADATYTPPLDTTLNDFDPTTQLGRYIQDISSNTVNEVVVLSNGVLTVNGESINIGEIETGVVSINGKDGEVTLTGDDINVSSNDTKTINTALAGKMPSTATGSDIPTAATPGSPTVANSISTLNNTTSTLSDSISTLNDTKASKADATLTPVYSDTPTFSEWMFTFEPNTFPAGPVVAVVFQPGGEAPDRWELQVDGRMIAVLPYAVDDTELVFSDIRVGSFDGIVTATRTRTDILGYQLGSQSDKPLASEAEAEALRTEVAGKASKSDVDPLLFAQYYPEGNVRSAAEFTAGIKYDAPDTTNRTITVKPFCNTGTAANDNSNLSGRVVIPPFVDADGNGYITDDGTRYKVVGVGDSDPGDPNTNLTAVVGATTVTIIGNNALNSCTALSSVLLPAAEAIEDDAFFDCTALTSISLPAATLVWDNVFVDCTALSSVSLPAATDIGAFALSSGGALTSISLPAATKIGRGAFWGCTSLTSVDFGDTPRSSVPTIGGNVFKSVPTTCKIIVPDEQFNDWTAETIPDPEHEGETIPNPWYDLVTAGYKFLRHSEWEYARKYEVDKKADKPATFTTGNLAALDANGNPVDSGIKSASLDSLAGNKYDFLTNADVYRAVKDIVEALGGSVTNFPAIP